jgi:beta-glucosidase
MIHATHTFPRGFLWGTATSSHQVEGDNTNNDWWDWEQQAGRIKDGQTSGKACDWWAGRWKDDLDRAAQAAQNTHRLSIEWSRVEPSPATWDEAALGYYREILRGALDRGLMPMVTLHHFTNPRWLAEEGGWLNPEVVPRFERYVRKVVGALHDLVGLWITINEPNVYSYAAYHVGVFPPGAHDLRKASRVLVHLIRAHAAAYHAIHEIDARSMVGIAHHYRGIRPAQPSNPFNLLVARVRSQTFNDAAARAASDGHFRFLQFRTRIPEAANTQDFLGLNYYTTEKCFLDLRRPGDLFGRSVYPAGADLSPTGFVANEPEGFTHALNWANGFRLPIYVTENGIEDEQDGIRPRYLAAHIRQMWKAVNIGQRVLGYYHWSLIDNFEWERGWSQRWGLWALDRATQARSKRPSADLYAGICKANALSSDMVGAYAPEVLERLFPSKGTADLGVVRA